MPKGPRYERFVYTEEDTLEVSQCINCIHKHAGSPTCDAFPEGPIPTNILTNDFTHDHPHPSQENNIVFEPDGAN